MLAYAAGRPRIGARQSSPNAMLVVICAHIALIAVAMSARMATAPHHKDPPTTIISVPIERIPPPHVTPQAPRQQPTNSRTPDEPREVPTTTKQPEVPLNLGGAVEPPSAPFGEIAPVPDLPKPPPPLQVTSSAQLLTPSSELRPPYPQAKLLAGEEAALTLRLSIDERGRVVAVDPVGRADPAFLAAARRHLLAHWRYKPAMKGGRAVASAMVITLRFQLDD